MKLNNPSTYDLWKSKTDLVGQYRKETESSKVLSWYFGLLFIASALLNVWLLTTIC